MSLRRSIASLVAPLVLAGCGSGGDDAPAWTAPDRDPTDRTPITAPCDDADPVRCLLPWPSSTFTTKDPTTETGLRLHVDASSLLAHDDPRWLALADGFSRVTPLVAGFPGAIAAPPAAADGGGPMRLLVAQPGSPRFGEPVGLRYAVQVGATADDARESLLFGYPLRPLEANADYVGVVLDALTTTDGASLPPSRATQVAVGVAAPDSQAEADLFGWHAPTRAVLAKAGIDPARVLRVFSFTTRSKEDPLKRLADMRAQALDAVAKAKVSVAIDDVKLAPDPSIALVVKGHLAGLPRFLDPGPNTALTLGEDGLARASGTRDAPFRVVVPAGTGDYRVVMYGHGTGGQFDDPSLDDVAAAAGAAKVGIQLDGWTGTDVIDTFVGLQSVMIGAHHAAAMLMQALADNAAIQASLPGALGDALAAATIGGKPNPAAGRRPDVSSPIWAGGSLGGTMGLVASCLEPTTKAGVLNVPGAAWTHFVPHSIVFDAVRAVLRAPYHGDVDLVHALAMSQGIWDEIDGAAWSARLEGRATTFLAQEVLGDPVLPNPGNEMVAVVTAATQVGAVLAPVPAGLPEASEVDGASGYTQFAVSDTGAYDVHGFAGRDTPAGRAAREQIGAFVASVWAGAPRIAIPAGCAGGSCDFRGE